MHSTQVPKKLLAAQGIDYESLPVLPEKNTGKAVGHFFKKVAITVLKMTVIGAVAIFAIKQLAETLIRLNCSLQNRNLTPLGKQRLQETEKKIRALAKKAGFENYQQIKLSVQKTGSPAAAIGKATIITSPEYLVQPKDLPEELKLSRLDKNELTEEEWVVKFNAWVGRNILTEKKSTPKSQFEVDATLAYGKAFLRLYRDQKGFKKGFEAVVGHELGHCSHRHSLKTSLADFGWDKCWPYLLWVFLPYFMTKF